MKSEFVLAFNELIESKQLPREVVLSALKKALETAYRKHVNISESQLVEVEIDMQSGAVTIFAEKEVVDEVQDERTEVTLEEARRFNKNARLGDIVVVETTPANFGRVAAQTARQVIQQRIREAERDEQFEYFSKQVGEIISGVVQAITSNGLTIGLEKRAEGLMPRSHMIPNEKLRLHDRVRALLLEVKNDPRGPEIILSRAHRNFLRRLLENEVPEIYHGMVEIRSIAREPGYRSKVAVVGLQPGIDPVGACVGIRGVRIQAIVRELHNEKIDVIEWSQDAAAYIAKALSPARVAGVYLQEYAAEAKTATVVVPEDQLSLAIGRDGINARLAAKLTGWRIDIKSLPEAVSDALFKLANDPRYSEVARIESDTIPQVEAIMTKKAEGRPVTPEEYQVLSQFVDRVERSLLILEEATARRQEEQERIARTGIPKSAFEIPLAEFEISDRVFNVISEAGFPTVGDLMVQMKLDPDRILALHGMGPKGLKELQEALDALESRLKLEEEMAAPMLEEIEPTAGIPMPVESELAKVESAAEEAPLAEGIEEEVVVPEAIPELEEVPSAELAGEGLELVAEAEVAEPLELVEDHAKALEDLFTMEPEEFEVDFLEDEESEDEEIDEQKLRKRKKKKKGRRFVEIEYDPEQDFSLARKKHKRGEDDWVDW